MICGCELEYFDALPRDDKSLLTNFWREFIACVRTNVASIPGVRSGSQYAKPNQPWDEFPTILFLENGGKLYLDSHGGSFAKCWPEWATPECNNPLELAAYSFAMDKMVGKAFQHARNEVLHGTRKFAAIYRISCPHAVGFTKGFHESYSIPTSLFPQLVRQDVPICRNIWIPFLATRSLLCGPGYLDSQGQLTISLRAKRTERLTGSVGPDMNPEQNVRSCIDTRDDYFCGKFSRLHVVCGEVPLTLHSAKLQFGVTGLVLVALANLMNPKSVLTLHDEENLNLSLFPQCSDFPNLDTPSRQRLVKIQLKLFDWVNKHLPRRVPAWTNEVLKLWDETLHAVQSLEEKMQGDPPWKTVRFLLREQLGCGRSHEDTANHLNAASQLHGIDAEGFRWETANFEDLTRQPPSVPRALARAKAVRQNRSSSRVDWDLFITFDAKNVCSIQILDDAGKPDMVDASLWFNSGHDALDFMQRAAMLEKICEEIVLCSDPNKVAIRLSPQWNIWMANQAKLLEKSFNSMVCDEGRSKTILSDAINSIRQGVLSSFFTNKNKVADEDEKRSQILASAVKKLAKLSSKLAGQPDDDGKLWLISHLFWLNSLVDQATRMPDKLAALILRSTVESKLRQWELAEASLNLAMEDTLKLQTEQLIELAEDFFIAGKNYWDSANGVSDEYEKKLIFSLTRKAFSHAVLCENRRDPPNATLRLYYSWLGGASLRLNLFQNAANERKKAYELSQSDGQLANEAHALGHVYFEWAKAMKSRDLFTKCKFWFQESLKHYEQLPNELSDSIHDEMKCATDHLQLLSKKGI